MKIFTSVSITRGGQVPESAEFFVQCWQALECCNVFAPFLCYDPGISLNV